MILEHLEDKPTFDLLGTEPSQLPKSVDSVSLDSSKGTDTSGKSDDGKPVKRGRKSRPKVKTGCAVCKQRRIKCDEARPSCTQCVRSKKECMGYPPPPRSSRPEYEVRIAPKPSESGRAHSSSISSAMAPSHLIPTIDEPPYPSLLGSGAALPSRGTGRRRGTHSSASSPIPESAASSHDQNSTLPVMGTDRFYFRIFQDHTANELSGFFDSSFYTERVLAACRNEPAIRHAAIALGALHKTLEQSWGASGAPPGPPKERGEQLMHWQMAVRQYSEACNVMMASRDPSESSLRTQLMASILLASFDSFIGDHRQAIVQIQNGLDLLERIRAEQRLPAYGLATDTAEEELTVIFMRLAIQAKSYDLGFHFPEPYVVRFTSPAQHQALLQQLSQQHPQPELGVDAYLSHLSPGSIYESRSTTPSGSPPPLQPFASVHEARVAHDRLHERMIKLQESLHMRPRELAQMAITETWVRASSSFKSQLASWSEAFQPLLLSRHGPHVSSRERAAINVLQMAHLTASLVSEVQFTGSELVFDKYTGIFQSIVDLGLEVIQEEEAFGAAACQAESAYCPHQRQLYPDYASPSLFSACHVKPIFSMDFGIVAPLFVVGTKCRLPILRRQAIELLRGCSRREGMWDSNLTALIAHWIMTLEESPSEVHNNSFPEFASHPASKGYDELAPTSLPEFLHDPGLHLTGQPYAQVPEEKRVMLKSVDFDLRARWANVVVGTRSVPDGLPDPRFRSTQLTW